MATIVATPVPNRGGIELDITFSAAVTKILVERQVPGAAWQTIASGETPISTTKEMDDYEAPLDVAVVYRATQTIPAGSETATSAPVTLTSINEGGWLKDPGYPTTNVPVSIITSIRTLTRPSRAGVFNILDRVNPIVVTAKRQGAIGELVMHTTTDAERIALTDLLARGTVLLLQTPPRFGFGSQYVHIADAVEERVALAMEQTRKWVLPFLVVDRPEGLTITPVGKTWRDVRTIYPTWADLKASGKTWRQLLEEGP
jgi:hypothetical protein